MYCTVKTTECVTDLDQQNEMIFFGSILTTLLSSIIFGSSWGSIENHLEPKTKLPLGNVAFLNLWNALYVHRTPSGPKNSGRCSKVIYVMKSQIEASK